MAFRAILRRCFAPLTVLTMCGGCGLILGLDEFVDAPPGSGGAGGTASGSTCTDGVLSGDESDVDCGGSCAARCGPGQTCHGDADCAGGTCASDVCQPTCADGVQNGMETDIDCGGGECQPCAVTDACIEDSDCLSGICNAMLCADSLVWAAALGGVSEELPAGLGIDSAGAIFLQGIFSGTTNLGGGSLMGAGGGDVFVVKLDPSGNHVWSKALGGAELEIPGGVSATAAGDALFSGVFTTSINWGGMPLSSAGGYEIYLAKLNTAGGHVWSKRFGTTYTEVVIDVHVDAAASVFIVGGYAADITFGGPALQGYNNFSPNVFVVKLGSSGSHVWSRGFPAAGTQTASFVDVDGSGNVLVAGTIEGSVDFGGGPLASAGSTDIFLLKLDPGGNHVWSRRFGNADPQQPTALAVDAGGNVVLAGRFDGILDLGGEPLISSGSSDMFIVKLDAAGDHVWSKSYDDESASDPPVLLAMTPEGKVVVAGSYSGAIDFGGGFLSSAGATDVFLLELDPHGNHLRSRRFGDGSAQTTSALALSGEHVFLTGTFEGSVDFGAGPLTSAGGADIFVAKLLAP